MGGSNDTEPNELIVMPMGSLVSGLLAVITVTPVGNLPKAVLNSRDVKSALRGGILWGDTTYRPIICIINCIN